MLRGMKKYDIKMKDLKKRFLYGIPMSRNTIKRRIATIASDIKEQLVSDLSASPIGHAFQSDSSTDIDNKEQLVAFVR